MTSISINCAHSTIDSNWELGLRKFIEATDGILLLKDIDPIQALTSGSDLDFLVRDPESAFRCLKQYLGAPLYRARFGCFYEWGHVDLIPYIAWKGACLFKTNEVFYGANSQSPERKVADSCVEGLLFWLRPPIWGGIFKPGCEAKVKQALVESPDRFEKLLVSAFGKRTGAQLMDIAKSSDLEAVLPLVSHIRRKLWCRRFFRNPVTTLARLFGHLWTESMLRLRPPMPWIAVIGPDGSGKSTIIETLKQTTRSTIPQVRVFHSRPAVFRPGPPGAGPATNPQDQIPRGLATSVLKLAFLLLDWWAGYWMRIAPAGAKVTLVLFDGFFPDLLVDPKRYRYGGPMWFAKFVWKFMPKPDLVILLDAPAKVLQSRKQEVPFHETERQLLVYRNLVNGMKQGKIVNCDRTVEEVTRDVRCLILNAITRRKVNIFKQRK